MSLISFSPIQDGVTGVNATATNTPLSTIYNDYNGNITDANISSSAAIDYSKISLPLSLGYAQAIVNITTGATTATATGLTTTVTIPSGSRRIKITVCGGLLFHTTGGQTSYVTIWDGTVGSGTQLARQNAYAPVNNTGSPFCCIAVVTPSAGSKTYNVGLHGSGAGASIEASATEPVFILVEAM